MKTILTALFMTLATQGFAFSEFDRDDSLDLLSYKRGISQPIHETPIGLLAASCELKRNNAIVVIYMTDDEMHFVVSKDGQKFFKGISTVTEIEPYNFLFEDNKKRTSIYLKRNAKNSWKLVKNKSGDFSSYSCDDHSPTLELFLRSLDLPTIEMLKQLN